MEDDVRVQYEGFRPGMYVRVEIQAMPWEFVNNFDPSYPVVLGGLLSGEDDIGFLQVLIQCNVVVHFHPDKRGMTFNIFPTVFLSKRFPIVNGDMRNS